MIPCKAETPKTEEGHRNEGSYPARAFIGRHDAGAYVNGVAGLHGDKATPGDRGAAIQDTGDDVAEEEIEVAPCCGYVGCEVVVEFAKQVFLVGFVAMVSGQQGRGFVEPI